MVNSFLGYLVQILNSVLPVLNLPPDFIVGIDGAIAFVVNLLQGASYFIPLDVYVTCLGVMLLIDNFSLIVRVVRWLISLIPFLGGS